MADVLIYADSVPLGGHAPCDPARRSRPVPLRRGERREARLHALDGGAAAARARALRRPPLGGVRRRRARRGRARLEARSAPSSRCARWRASGSKRASVPENFPVWLADRLRADGVELDVDQDLFDDRRRVEDRGAARRDATRAESGRGRRWTRAASCSARSEISGDELVLDGEPLTVERVKAAMSSAFAAHDTTADEYIVAPGAQGAVGHDMGSGPIPPHTPLVVDIFPRDNASAVYTDMTRTFVVGDVADDVREWHRLVKEALDRALAEIRAGADGARDLRRHVRDLRGGGRADAADEEAGRAARGRLLPRARPRRRPRGARGAEHGPARRQAARRRATSSPSSRGSTAPGYGGVRLEDIVLVTETGAENLTDYPYDLEPSDRADAIETMLLEERRYPPPAEFAAQANAQPDIYDVPFEEFWEREGRERRRPGSSRSPSSTSGSRRMRSGTSAASSTSASTASTGTSRPGAATRSRSTGRASRRAKARRSRTPTSSATSSASRTR